MSDGVIITIVICVAVIILAYIGSKKKLRIGVGYGIYTFKESIAR